MFNIKRLLDISHLKNKKCKLIKENMDYKEIECQLTYKADVLLIDEELIHIFGDVDLSNPHIYFKICFKNNLYQKDFYFLK